MKEKQVKILPIFLLPFVFTAFSFLITYFDNIDLVGIINLVRSSLPLLLQEITSFSFYTKLSVIQIVGAWGFIGIGAYVAYYYLNSSYCAAHNYMVKRFYYTHPQEEAFNLGRWARLATHFLIIFTYSALTVTLFLFLLPAGEYLRRLSYNNFYLQNNVYRQLLSYSLLYIYWFFGVVVLTYLSTRTKKSVEEEKIEEEHCAV